MHYQSLDQLTQGWGDYRKERSMPCRKQPEDYHKSP
ncbi:Uncharacterised protein [Vibrio cholerae]|nr:Uncharacterised protein [Vibrio cholerae]